MVRHENVRGKLAGLRRTLAMICTFRTHSIDAIRADAEFRNALVHGYENLDYAIVEDAMRVRSEDIEEFARRVEGLLAG
jgi:uncharacterized protein YutE (UPF0331/DUF86 family)